MEKRLIYINVLFLSAILFQSCELVDVTNIQPPNELSEKTVITDISTAEKVLTGVYAQLHSFDLIVNQPGTTACMGISMVPGSMGGADYQQFHNNSVSSDNYLLAGIYTQWYYIINVSSHVIQKTRKLDTNDPRKNEIIAEASFLRALGHFYLLRWFGKFYDTNSELGVVTWNTPVEDIVPKARNNVNDSYSQILDDLDFACEYAPAYRTAVYASKQAAKVLKAKVLLYKRDYKAAAEVATDAIADKGNAVLEKPFSDIFANWFNSKEALIAPPFDSSNERNNKAYAFRAWFLPAASFYERMGDDKRRDATVYWSTPTTLRNGKFQNTSSGGQTLTANTEYYLRFAEIYLIQAEALVRSSSGMENFQKGRDAINIIRSRADMPAIEQIVNTKKELLDIILKEKQMEFGCESGEDWFDLVRFAVEGDLNLKDYKDKVLSENQYILPIPAGSIKASYGVVVQNPGY
jgi:hypothetical protein